MSFQCPTHGASVSHLIDSPGRHDSTAGSYQVATWGGVSAWFISPSAFEWRDTHTRNPRSLVALRRSSTYGSLETLVAEDATGHSPVGVFLSFIFCFLVSSFLSSFFTIFSSTFSLLCFRIPFSSSPFACAVWPSQNPARPRGSYVTQCSGTVKSQRDNNGH